MINALNKIFNNDIPNKFSFDLDDLNVNHEITNFNFDVYKCFNQDLHNMNRQELFEHWYTNGFYEERIYNIQQFKKEYPNFNKESFEYFNKKTIDNIYSNEFYFPISNYYTKKYKYEIIYHIMKINNVEIEDDIILKNSEGHHKICTLIHCGNIDIFKEILNDYPSFFDSKIDNILITCHTEDIKNELQQLLPSSIILIIENQGCDIGGFLKKLKYLKENNLCYEYFILLHTKTNKKWRDRMLKPLNIVLDNLRISNGNYFPTIYSSFDNVFPNYKLVNRNNIFEIIERNFEFEKKDILDYIDIYHDKNIYSPNNNINFYGGLESNESFYKYYEGLKIRHFHDYGIKEFHRVSNINYIKTFAKKNNNFVAGTCFIFNKSYFNILKNIKDFDLEFDKLEKGRVLNTLEKKTHAWEYFFGILCYLHGGEIKDIYSNEYIDTKREIKQSSIINIPFEKTNIAFTLTKPHSNGISGGYRTLLKYINFLNQKGHYLDIYLGEIWIDKNIEQNLNDNVYGTPSCENWFKEDIKYYVNIINNFGEIDISKNNFFIGLKFQKKYKYGIANAWQTALGVKFNKNKCKNLIYIIQDREDLFYDNQELKSNVLKTYSNDFRYYCLSNYLTNYFKIKYNFRNIVNSFLTAESNIYYDKKGIRENKIVIFYYPDKKGRNHKLVEKVLYKLDSVNIKMIVLPYECKLESVNIEYPGRLTPQQLNELYNTCKVGMVFSLTNPSRLGYEMLFSGLNVIEYDNEFTKYDLLSDYFTKIKDEKNIINIVYTLFNYKINSNLRDEFIRKHSNDNELEVFSKMFEN